MHKWIKKIIIASSIVLTLTGCSGEEVTKDTVQPVAVNGTMSVYYLDVGQGDSTYIETARGENILIDGGDNLHGSTVVEDLKKLQVADIDVLIATHPDADHIGGLDTVLDAIPVKSVYAPKVINTTKTYEDFVLAVKRSGLKIKPVKADIKLPLKSMNGVFVAPVKEYEDELNDWSAVLRLGFGNTSFLFTGDAPIRSEEDMIASGQDLTADVLKLGHHGSDTSSSQQFLEAVHPAYAVISVGKHNRYGHPNRKILKRLQDNKITYFRTDEQGTIIASSDGRKITWSTTPITKGSKEKKYKATSINKKSMEQNNTDTEHVTGNLKAVLDNKTPGKNDIVTLTVSGIPGADFKAVCHYKSKDTIYSGKVEKPLEFRIGRAAVGYPVTIDITVTSKGKTYTTQTSFTPE